jgi:hypothetical protein
VQLFVWVGPRSRTATKLLPNRPLSGHKVAEKPCSGAPPAGFEPATRRLEDVGKAFTEVCPRLGGLPDQGFCALQTPTNGYELLPQLLPNLLGRRLMKGLDDPIEIRFRSLLVPTRGLHQERGPLYRVAADTALANKMISLGALEGVQVAGGT